MATVPGILAALKKKGSENIRKIYARHGMSPDRVYGVKVADMKELAKTIKGRQDLACALLDSGNMEAMYLAGMVADGAKVTSAQLQAWLDGAADLQMISEYTIPWRAVENPKAREVALKWMDSKKEHVAAAGWCTYGGLLALKHDTELDLNEIDCLMQRVVKQIGAAPNRVKYCMNQFVISAGTYVKPLVTEAKAAASKLGSVIVDLGETECKVPLALASIEKAEGSGRLGKKRKTIRC